MSGVGASELPLDAEEFLTWLATERGRSAATLKAYRRDLLTYLDWLADRGVSLAAAAETDVVDHVHHLRRLGRAPSSVARATVSVRSLHRFLAGEGLHESDPTAGVDVPTVPRGVPRALSEEQVASLLASPTSAEPAGLRDRAMLEVLYGMGLRISELVGLSLGDLDLDDRLLRVFGKGSKERIVPVGRHAATALADWLSGAGRDAMAPERWASRDAETAMFLNARGGRLSRQGAWLVVRKHGDRVGLGAELTPHVLRHSCATHMLDHGADIRSVQELLGHASISSTQRYTAVSQQRLTEVYREAHPRARG